MAVSCVCCGHCVLIVLIAFDCVQELHAVVSGDKSGVTLDMPGTVDGWSPGEGFITVTIDGQYWTPITEPTAKLTLGPEPKAKK